MKGKQVIQTVAVVLGFIGLLVGAVLSMRQQKEQVVRGFDVKIDALEGDPFLNENEVRMLVESKLDTIKGKKQKDINLREIEDLLDSQVVVKNADVYLGVNGMLAVDLSLKTMLIRVKPENTPGYYIDAEGKTMPWVKYYSPRVLTVTGALDQYQIKALPALSSEQRTKLFNQDLYEFAQYVYKDDFWSKQLVQVDINSRGDAELITLIGDQKIIFGELKGAEKKLDKLSLFYNEVISKVGWKKYQEINLKFDNQIVCN